ncbi:hypothetical protein ACSNOK_20025 [Streptomyces sp. URMC 126]|uniref:hypothetical protein n=1 Tax=Streptomyces sp. URMC 126 TaxID=3423401 RepID=UPI003F1D2E1E
MPNAVSGKVRNSAAHPTLVLGRQPAVVNTVVMSTSDRPRDFATLRLTGGSDRRVLGTVAGKRS